MKIYDLRFYAVVTKLALALAAAQLFQGPIPCRAAADTLSETLQKALFEEEANHNLDAAIKAYQSVLQQTDEQRKLAATAVFRLGECYRKLGKTNEATAQYERILRQFADQTPLADLSRQNLAGFGVATPAGAKAGEVSRLGNDEEREVEGIKRMIKDSPDLINAIPGDGPWNPLQRAASEGKLAVARFLLANKADVNMRTKHGEMPLHLAAGSGHKSMVELLLANGADPNAQSSSDGATALHSAAARGYKSVVELLIANKAEVNARNSAGQTGLHAAAEAGQTPIAELLLMNGADINARDSEGNTTLHLAAEQNHLPLVNLFLSQKAEVDALDKAGRTALFRAVIRKNVAIAETLLNSGANVNLRRGNASPLQAALYAGSPELLKLLLAHKPDLEAKDYDGLTLLQAAIYTQGQRGGPGSLDMLQTLLAAKPELNAIFRSIGKARTIQRRWPSGVQPYDINGLTPLMVSIVAGREDFVDALLASGADVNAKSEGGSTALQYAVEQGSLQMVQAVLAHHPERDVRDANGYTAFSKASFAYPRIIEALLFAGANPNSTDHYGNTRLHDAVSGLRKDIVELLVTNKADVNVMNNNRQTPLDLTQRGGSTPHRPTTDYAILDQIALFLIKHGADETLHRRSSISASRPERNLNSPVFLKGTDDHNRYTLLEFISAHYSGGGGFSFPDFANLKIKRLSSKPGGTNEVINVDLEKLLQSGDCSQDLWLQWGDIVEIPEMDHAVRQPWFGLSQDTVSVLRKCLKREVEIMVKGETTTLTLVLPNLQQNPQPVPGGVILGGIGDQESWKNIRSFRLKEVINSANVVRISSDLSRVKVKRMDTKTGQVQELMFDLSDAAPSDARTDLWLRDGDVIELPEKQ